MKFVLPWVVGFFALLAASFFEPMFALLAYLQDYYAHPDIRPWGKFLPDLRWSLFAGSVLLFTYLLKHGGLLRPVIRHTQTWFLLGFLLIASLVTPFAVDYTRSVDYLAGLAKLVLLYALIAGTVRTPKHFRWFILVMIAGGLMWGIDAYLDPHRVAGRLRRIGGPDSYSDNAAAAHLVTALPFIGVLLWLGRPGERLLAFCAAPFILNTIILCNSRGSTLAILVSGLTAIVFIPSRFRLRLAGAMLLAGALFVYLTDPTFVRRQLTMFEETRDASAEGRLESWSGAMDLIRDHPLGTGGGGYDALSPKYIADLVEEHGGEARAVHNTYLWVASDWGIPGFICFLGFILSTLASLHRIRRNATDPAIALQAFAIESALLGFLTAAMFINRAYGEVLYWLAGLTVALRNIQLAEQPAAAPEPATVPIRPLAPVRRPAPLYAHTRQG